ncbi:hypothetical protein [Sphingopyxis sp. 113P3]|uniref:hypothetical protein n=1 Tax=Sphingopyxis sp. (strain 113P3) TaxID=292913 RepID=UPI0006BC32D7|nr:hypothetical protein [Sphingopyxis sp. 113P3]ALC13833.1 hypothetical protein LH20_17895 [Sphingopyxis sp. 113P3]
MFRAGQPNFSRGVLSEHLHGRFDVDAYSAGLKQGTNVIILKYGGVTKRPGTRLVAEVMDGSEPTRIIPFQFSLTQTYALEMGQGYMAPCAYGGRVLEEELAITNITNAANAQITAAFHEYEVGQQVYLAGIAGTLGDFLNNRFWSVASVVDTDNFTIDADTTELSAFDTAEGGITRSEAPDPPPAPPVVPPPVEPPPLPDVGGGGGGGFCVTDDTPFLLANADRTGPGAEIPAGLVTADDWVWTRHEVTGEWGAFPVARVEFADMPVLRCHMDGWRQPIHATAEHPFEAELGAGPSSWIYARDIGEPAGIARVARIEVADAHTYVSAGVLSHNKRSEPDEDRL